MSFAYAESKPQINVSVKFISVIECISEIAKSWSVFPRNRGSTLYHMT